jgi:predicted transcriptional regulator
MTILLSIKPEYAIKIFEGSKKYEFRRTIFKRPDVNRIVVYASSPIQKIIGEFKIDKILNDDVETIWKITEHMAGITKDCYYEYFANRDKAFAIQIGVTKKYNKPKILADFNLDFTPQSFVYL